MQKYYKVVNSDKTSARVIENFAVVYKIGQFVYPRLEKSKLFVFDNLEAANQFASYYETIFECEVVNPVKAKYIACYAPNIKEFWNLKARKKSVSSVAEHSIKGTVFCDAVKLTREII